jgi:hypothetical protein
MLCSLCCHAVHVAKLEGALVLVSVDNFMLNALFVCFLVGCPVESILSWLLRPLIVSIAHREGIGASYAFLDHRGLSGEL